MSAIYRIIFLIVVAVLVLVAIVIGIQNGEEVVDLHLLVWSWVQIPMVVVMIVCMAFGMFLAIVVALPYEIRLYFRLKMQQRDSRSLRVELDNMRNIPLGGIEDAIKDGLEKKKPVEEETE
jgi:uncharacterized membrane protein YciS (DUF1049 family)